MDFSLFGAIQGWTTAAGINNVLQAVGGGGALIERKPGDAEAVRRLARMVVEAAERGSSVTRRLLAFARRGDLRAEPLQAHELLGEMREILGHTLGAGIAVRVDAPDALPAMLADKAQLETVLVNLAANARDAMGGRGVIILGAVAEAVEERDRFHTATLRPGAYVQLSVADTGTGMTPDVLARASEPFFTTKAQGQGTGLGLAMASGFAEQSGGALAIESEAGRGTVVRLWFPVAVQGPGTPEQATRAAAPTALGRGSLTVLLVDDDAPAREITAEGLEEAGMRVVAVPNAAAALERLAAGLAADSVVADYSMPEMDGLTLIQETQSRWPGLPAILLTGFATNAAELAVGGAVSGSFSLLRKPISAVTLAERIEVLLAAVASGRR